MHGCSGLVSMQIPGGGAARPRTREVHSLATSVRRLAVVRFELYHCFPNARGPMDERERTPSSIELLIRSA